MKKLNIGISFLPTEQLIKNKLKILNNIILLHKINE